MSELVIAALAGAAFLAGLIDSIAGGGGLLLVPALLVAGVPPQFALGTNKLAGSCGTTFALANFIRGKAVVWKVVGYGLVFSLIGSWLGGQMVLALPPASVAKIIIGLLPFAAIAVLIPKRNGEEMKDISPTKLWLAVPLVCTAIGFYDGFFGPGTGSFLILALHFFIGLPLVSASATSKVFNLASNVSALVVFFLSGNVLIALGLILAVANIGGNLLGSHLTLRHGEKIVRIALIIALAILLISLVVKYF